MPIGQGNALWSLQRVISQPRSTKETENKDTKSVPSSHSSSFWRSANPSNFFLRRFSSTPCRSPKRSASAPQGLPQNIPQNPGTSDPPDSSVRDGSSCESSIIKSKSAPHAFPVKPDFLDLSEFRSKFSEDPSTSDSAVSSPENITSVSSALSNKPSPILSDNLSSKPSPSKLLSPQPTQKKKSNVRLLTQHSSSLKGSLPPSPSLCPQKMARSQSPHCRHLSSSSLHSSPLTSPLKSSPTHPSQSLSAQGEQVPVTPRPPWSELMEARRRLMAVEGRRRALCALETRVQQVHCVFVQAEMRVARQKEGLAKLVEAAGRAEVQSAVHGQKIRKATRHHKPRLLACALCMPWPTKSERRGIPHPRHSRCTLFQGRNQVLRGCVSSDDMSPRD